MTLTSQDAFKALQRFGLGARGEHTDLDAIASDPRAAVLEELAADPPQPAAAGLPTTSAAFEALDTFRAERQQAREQAAADPNAPPERVARVPLLTYLDEARARLALAATPRIGFAERLVWFWSNHFCIAVSKGQQSRITAGAFEREAIRPHVFGRFADMLLAVEQHPAMLIYLDNHRSTGPNSPAGKRRGRGLNENLAREILELHTLGVDGGYSQADVTALAKIITGWSLVGSRDENLRRGDFRFNPHRHEPGDKTLRGKTYPEAGVVQGEAALRDLAHDPATARFIATKLARHFVADEPPPALVERLTRRFQDTDGDLREVAAALVGAEEAWREPLSKIRSPQDYLVATHRALGWAPEADQSLRALRGLGQPLWDPPGPDGFPDGFDHWGSAEGVKTRLDVAVRFTRQAPRDINPNELVDTVLGPAASKATRQTVARAESRAQGLALLLMAPEFQRR